MATQCLLLSAILIAGQSLATGPEVSPEELQQLFLSFESIRSFDCAYTIATRRTRLALSAGDPLSRLLGAPLDPSQERFHALVMEVSTRASRSEVGQWRVHFLRDRVLQEPAYATDLAHSGGVSILVAPPHTLTYSPRNRQLSHNSSSFRVQLATPDTLTIPLSNASARWSWSLSRTGAADQVRYSARNGQSLGSFEVIVDSFTCLPLLAKLNQVTSDGAPSSCFLSFYDYAPVDGLQQLWLSRTVQLQITPVGVLLTENTLSDVLPMRESAFPRLGISMDTRLVDFSLPTGIVYFDSPLVTGVCPEPILQLIAVASTEPGLPSLHPIDSK